MVGTCEAGCEGCPFVQIPMKGPPVVMKIDSTLLKYILEMYPEYDEYIKVDGSLITGVEGNVMCDAYIKRKHDIIYIVDLMVLAKRE